MATYPFWLYDTAPFSTVANTTHTLFQIPQGGDSTHTKQFTNMRASAALPQNEKMVIRAIHAIIWDEVPEADLHDVWDGSYLEMTISDELLFRVPLVMCASMNAWGGSTNETAGAGLGAIGKMGSGLLLNPSIELIGGDSFKVEVFQQEVMTAQENIWIVLEGILNR